MDCYRKRIKGGMKWLKNWKGIKGGEKSNKCNLSNQQVENVSVTGGRLNKQVENIDVTGEEL